MLPTIYPILYCTQLHIQEEEDMKPKICYFKSDRQEMLPVSGTNKSVINGTVEHISIYSNK